MSVGGLVDAPMAADAVTFGGWDWSGNFTTIDLIAASTNALNGALLARRPDHYKNFTVVGIILMALLGGLGGGMTRDILVARFRPRSRTPPTSRSARLRGGRLPARLHRGKLFREGLFQFMTSFSLPWYAIAGAQKGVTAGIPVFGCIVLAVVGPTAGRCSSTSRAVCRRSSSSGASGSSRSRR